MRTIVLALFVSVLFVSASSSLLHADEPTSNEETPAVAPGAADALTRSREGVETMTIFGSNGDLSRIGGSAYVVDEQKLEDLEYDDINRVLRQVPGVYIREEDGFGLRPNIGIRGATSDRSAKVTLMEDRILFGPAPYSAPAAYYFPLVTRMVGVEVFKGPSSVQFGPHTVGGAINLVTRPIPDEPTIFGDVAYGQRNYYKLHSYGGGRWNGFGLLLEGVRVETDGFKDLDGGGDTGFAKDEFMLKGDYLWPTISEVDLTTEVKLGFADETSRESYLGISDDDFGTTPYRRYAASRLDRMEWDRWQFQLSQLVGITDDLSVRATAYRNQMERAWKKLNRFDGDAPPLHDIFANPTGVNAVYLSILRGDSDSNPDVTDEALLIGINDREFVSQGLDFVGNWDIDTGPFEHVLEAGVRVHYDEIVRDHTEDSYLMLNANPEPTGDPRRQIADNTGDALAVAVYLHDEIIWDRLTISPGLRFESISTDFEDRLPELDDLPAERDSDTQNIVIPGISGVYSIIDTGDDEVGLLAGVHRGFSPVSPGQSSAADPEDSINYEAGARYLGSLFNTSAIGFFNDYDNLLATCRSGAGCDPEDIDKQFNGGDVDIYGLELTADTAPEVGWEVSVPMALAYTFTQTEFRSSFNSAGAIFGDVEKGDEMPYVPEHLVNFSIGLTRGPFGFTTILNYVGEQRDVAGQGSIPANEKIDDYFFADLVAHWDFSDRGRIYLGIDNLADNAYIVSRRPYGARPGMPFQVMGGIKYQLGG